jgi:hypothetical protein
LLDAYSEGMKGAVRHKLANADEALSALNNVSHYESEIARIEKDKKDTTWRKELRDVPAAQLAKLDAGRQAEYSKELAENRARLKATWAEAAALKAKAR